GLRRGGGGVGGERSGGREQQAGGEQAAHRGRGLHAASSTGIALSRMYWRSVASTWPHWADVSVAGRVLTSSSLSTMPSRNVVQPRQCVRPACRVSTQAWPLRVSVSVGLSSSQAPSPVPSRSSVTVWVAGSNARTVTVCRPAGPSSHGAAMSTVQCCPTCSVVGAGPQRRGLYARPLASVLGAHLPS